MNDEKIRSFFIKKYLKNISSEVIILNEVGVVNGSAIIDIAAISPESIEGFEIKSADDNLRRLPRQVRFYDRTFDFISIITEPKYIDESIKIIPSHWGVVMAVESDSGEDVEFTQIRYPVMNQNNDKKSISLLLWKRELMAALFELGHKGISTFRVSKLRSIFCEYPDDVIRRTLHKFIKIRPEWKDQINSQN